jgi:hypothetical protein
MNKARLTSSAAMLITASVRRPAEFYRDTPGFEVDFIYEGRVPNALPREFVQRGAPVKWPPTDQRIG